MKVLFVSTHLPHAGVVSGHQIVYERIRGLAARGHEIGLIVFDGAGEEEHAASMRPYLREIRFVPRPARCTPAGLLCRSLFRRIPPVYAASFSAAMEQCIGVVCERGGYDVILAEYGTTGQHLRHNRFLPAVRTVISVHHFHSMASYKARIVTGKPAGAAEWFPQQALQRYESDIFRCADHLVCLTPEERDAILGLGPDLHITVVPCGVDPAHFAPDPHARREAAIVFTGYFNDTPNCDALMWFARTAWPGLKRRHPDLVLYAVGAGPSPDLVALSRRDPRIVVTGEVDDIRPYLNRARVFVCPMRLGSGMRVKLLQAMASGLPVVSTTVGAEGIPIEMGENGFLADTPGGFVQYTDLLLTDPALHDRVASGGRRMVVGGFSWEHSLDRLETVLNALVA